MFNHVQPKKHPVLNCHSFTFIYIIIAIILHSEYLLLFNQRGHDILCFFDQKQKRQSEKPRPTQPLPTKWLPVLAKRRSVSYGTVNISVGDMLGRTNLIIVHQPKEICILNIQKCLFNIIHFFCEIYMFRCFFGCEICQQIHHRSKALPQGQGLAEAHCLGHHRRAGGRREALDGIRRRCRRSTALGSTVTSPLKSKEHHFVVSLTQCWQFAAFLKCFSFSCTNLRITRCWAETEPPRKVWIRSPPWSSGTASAPSSQHWTYPTRPRAVGKGMAWRWGR